ncbi:MAG TPA: carboxypeptidase-like regulatory domain-containing protein [Bacteroidota bacterium]
MVTDSTNGERLPGVNVRVEGTGRGWVTNANGFYLIAAVPRGRHTVTASAVGYRSRGLTVDVTGSEAISLNIVLVPRVIESSEVMIEGEREEEAVQRSASIHIVTPHDLQQVPSAAQADLFRTMELLPGISSTSSPDGFRPPLRAVQSSPTCP